MSHPDQARHCGHVDAAEPLAVVAAGIVGGLEIQPGAREHASGGDDARNLGLGAEVVVTGGEDDDDVLSDRVEDLEDQRPVERVWLRRNGVGVVPAP